jgi:hypothetical protein
VTESHQNAAAGHHAMTPRSAIPAKPARAQTVINAAGGKFCHAELRVCEADSPKRGRVPAESCLAEQQVSGRFRERPC